ncbi:MAG: glycosyltransferase family 4 protein [Acidobacteria bacterium]|nr:glycosyltransferase family 4 protein [Acidobacteriota bacterium]
MKVLFIERRPYATPSIERVFTQVAKDLRELGFEVAFEKLPFASSLAGVIGNLVFFRPQKADVYHLTGDGGYLLLKLPARKTVFTIHDMIALHTRRGIKRRILKWLFFGIPAKRARWITAVSYATRKELERHYDDLKGKIRIIPNPLIEGFVPAAEDRPSRDGVTVLQVGTAPNKNLPRLIEAMQGTGAHLRVIGYLSGEIRELLEENQVDFTNTERLSDEHVVAEYQKAATVTVCSTYEGFGLPIIEAQAVGTPVVASNISPMTEVAGDGAIFVKPNDPGSIREGILSVLNDEQTRRSVVERGFENVVRFRAANIAEQYAHLYREVIEKSQ